jgi:hypothetical protein
MKFSSAARIKYLRGECIERPATTGSSSVASTNVSKKAEMGFED